MDTTIRTVITIGRITAATITGPTMGTAGTAITTATTEITTIGGNKLTYLEIQIELAREQFRASFFFRSRSDENRRPAATSLVWATLPILSPDPWSAGQSETLFSVAELALAVAAVVPFRFAAATFVPLFGVPGCNAIQIERVPAGSGGGPSREPPPRSHA